MATKKKATKRPGKRTATSKAPAKRKAATKKKAPKESDLSFDEKLARGVAGDASSMLATGGSTELWSKPQYWISTRNIALDKRLGGRGLPGSKLIEVFGPESSGKSTLVDQCIAETQAQGGLAVLIDSEHARDPTYMTALGVDLEKLVVCQVNTIEQVFDKMHYWCEQARHIVEDPTKPVLIVWDSVAGTPTNEEFIAESTDNQFRASAAKVIKRGMRRTVQLMAASGVTVFVTNQVYSAMNKAWGDQKVTYGGDGIRYHATIRIDLMAVGKLKPRGAKAEDKVPPVGQIVSAIVVKNKVAPPMARARFAIVFGHGVDNAYAMWHDNCGPKVKPPPDAFITQSGSWYKLSEELGETRPWQGAHWGLNDLVQQEPKLWKKLIKAYSDLP